MKKLFLFVLICSYVSALTGRSCAHDDVMTVDIDRYDLGDSIEGNEECEEDEQDVDSGEEGESSNQEKEGIFQANEVENYQVYSSPMDKVARESYFNEKESDEIEKIHEASRKDAQSYIERKLSPNDEIPIFVDEFETMEEHARRMKRINASTLNSDWYPTTVMSCKK